MAGGPRLSIVARRLAGEGKNSLIVSIGVAFLIGGAFYIAFGAATSFVFALIVLGIAHTGGSILWVFRLSCCNAGLKTVFADASLLRSWHS